MMVDDQTNSSRSEARAFFAERLRTLRIPRGFRTARSFAKALGIDENRYTRYERAEVEPDLGLIRRICAMLGVTPNELLGLPNSTGKRPLLDPLRASEVGKNDEVRDDALNLPMTAWAISGLIAKARQQSQSDAAIDSTCPESFLREAGSIFSSILKSPEQAIDELAKEPALMAAGPEINREFIALRAQLAELADS